MGKDYTIFNCRLDKDVSDKLEAISETSGLSKTKIVEQAVMAMARHHGEAKSQPLFAWESDVVNNLVSDDSCLTPQKKMEIADKIIESNVQPLFEAVGLNILSGMTVAQFVSVLVQIMDMMDIEIPNPSLELSRNAKGGQYDMLDDEAFSDVVSNAKAASVLWHDNQSLSVKGILKEYVKVKFVAENL